MDCSKRSAGAAGSLPDDPLVEILSRVPFKSVCRFKCVSKAWRNLIGDPVHRKKLPQTLEGFFSDEDRSGGYRAMCYQDSEVWPRFHAGAKLASKSWWCTTMTAFQKLHHPNTTWRRPCFHGHFIDVLGRSVRPLDPCFSFLTELPGNENISFLHCCNGLFLFGRPCSSDISVSYIVCYPATEQWVAVPRSGRTSCLVLTRCTFTCLAFDPATDSSFHLVQFWKENSHRSVHTYSSKTGVWSHKKCNLPDWGRHYIIDDSPNAYVNAMLHLSVNDQLVSVDVDGNILKIVPPPVRADKECWLVPDYVGQSQGHLHYICHELVTGLKERLRNELLVWVLEDYDTQQWVLKDTVSFLKLFGENECKMGKRFTVVGIHPDHNLVYLVQLWNQKLISYNMDSKQVRDVCTLGHGYRYITPYAPYFSELSSLENKQ